MTTKTAVIVVTLFSIALIIAVYIHRGEWAIGPEWALPAIALAVVPLKEKEK